MNPVEFANLAPFLRITPVTVIGETIVDHNKAISIDVSKQAIERTNLKAKFGIKQLTLDVVGEVGSVYKLTLDIDVYDLSILEKTSDDLSLYELTKLNKIVKVEFG